MTDWPLVIIFLIYGSTFIVMAGVIWSHTQRTAKLGFAGSMYLLALFAATHGISDLVDVVLRLPGVDADPTGPVAAVRLAMLVTSFLFLLLYGISTLVEDTAIYHLVLALGSLAAVALVAGLVALYAEGVSVGTISHVEAAVRRFVGLPGGLLSSLGLLRISNRCSRVGLRQCRDGSRLAAFGMVAYAILAGAVATGYPQSIAVLGMPIQLHRMAAAIVLTIGCAWMLRALEVHPEEVG